MCWYQPVIVVKSHDFLCFLVSNGNSDLMMFFRDGYAMVLMTAKIAACEDADDCAREYTIHTKLCKNISR